MLAGAETAVRGAPQEMEVAPRVFPLRKALGNQTRNRYLERSLHNATGRSPPEEVVVMSGWLIVVIVLAVVFAFMSWRSRGRREIDLRDAANGTTDVGERWRTGGY